jgi:hypothetical protein
MYTAGLSSGDDEEHQLSFSASEGSYRRIQNTATKYSSVVLLFSTLIVLNIPYLMGLPFFEMPMFALRLQVSGCSSCR